MLAYGVGDSSFESLIPRKNYTQGNLALLACCLPVRVTSLFPEDIIQTLPTRSFPIGLSHISHKHVYKLHSLESKKVEGIKVVIPIWKPPL